MLKLSFIIHNFFMAKGEFEKTSWSWQTAQVQKQVGEWIELQFSRFDSNLPNLPEWSLSKWATDVIKAIAVLLVGLLLIWLCWQLWKRLEPYVYSFSQERNAADSVTTQTDRLSAKAWLKRSQTYLNQGNYREACRCLYMIGLQRLHDNAIAPHQPSRTDREYLQLIQQLPQSRSYQTLIATHEQLYFGNAEILPETFEQCQQAYREIVGEE